MVRYIEQREIKDNKKRSTKLGKQLRKQENNVDRGRMV